MTVHPRRERRIPAVVFGSMLLCVVGAHAGQQRSKPATHTVTIDATTFSPAELTVRPGDTVVWVNKDVIPHTATATATAKTARAFDSGTLRTGNSWKSTFDTRGDFPYVCTFHPTMKGRLIVK